jgi:ElaB/YqjD/DUF883 family membrane-anchored ribosome-binding protein
MAFQLPALPSFQTNIPQQIAAMPSPLEQYGKMLQLRQLSGQIEQQKQMQPLQVEQAQQAVQASTLENQQRQQELDSQKAMIKAWSDPDFLKGFTGTDAAQQSGMGFDPNALTSSLISKGVLPKDAMAMASQFVDRSAKIATTLKDQAQRDEANAGTRDKGMKILADKIGGILDMPASKAADGLAALKQDLINNPQAYAGVPKDDLAHIYGADLEHLPAMSTLIGLDGKIADFHKSKFEAEKASQGVIPPGGGLSPDTQQQVQKDIAVATNPQIQAGKVQVSAAEGIARANVEHQIATNGQAALAKVPTHLVAPATEAAIKAGTEYAQAKSVSDRLSAMMDAAKNGNVVSYQLIPEEGALQVTTSQGVHRINMAEIQNYGGGSLWQRLEGHVGKALTGESIPDSVLKDMSEMQKIQSEGARSKYENTLKTVNQATGADFKPVEMDTMKPAAQKTNAAVAQKTNAAVAVGQSITLKSGKTVKVTAVHPDGTFDAN